jgi:hypothetical protein
MQQSHRCFHITNWLQPVLVATYHQMRLTMVEEEHKVFVSHGLAQFGTDSCKKSCSNHTAAFET